MILGIDPGPTASGVCYFQSPTDFHAEKLENPALLSMLRGMDAGNRTMIAIEVITPYGTHVGADTFATCEFIGRITEIVAQRVLVARITRPEVKLHLLGKRTGNDALVREAVRARLGEPGTKKAPGPTFGVAKDAWSALAVSLAIYDQLRGDNGLGRSACAGLPNPIDCQAFLSATAGAHQQGQNT